MDLEAILTDPKHEAPALPEAAPVITIFVRHSPSCKYVGDEFCKRCDCKKHLRWTRNGKQYRRKTGTRTWAEAERKRRELEDLLTGKTPKIEAAKRITVEKAVETFMQAKRNDGLEPPSLKKLQKSCDRILEFSEKGGLYYLSDVNLTHISTWPWDKHFQTTHSLRNNQSRVKSFFRYFDKAGIIEDPTKAWPTIKGKTAQVSGFEKEEYKKILAAISKCGWSEEMQRKMHALVQVMRYAGLAILDASCLERAQILHTGKDVYRIRLRSRQKTSKRAHLQSIDNAIPPAVGRELMKVLNGNPRYVFWNYAGNGEASDAEKRNVAEKYWQRYMRTLLD